MFSLAIYWGNCLLSILIAKLGLMINKEKTTYIGHCLCASYFYNYLNSI